MKIGPLDPGYNPIRKVDAGLSLGDAEVVGGNSYKFVLSGAPIGLRVRIWVSGPAGLGGLGNAAGSQASNELLARQFEELLKNPDFMPVPIVWSSARALPQDGWYAVSQVSVDYTFVGAGRIPIDLTVSWVAPMPPHELRSVVMAGALATDLTGAAQSWATLPVGFSGPGGSVGSGTRPSAEGSLPYVIGPWGPSVPVQPGGPPFLPGSPYVGGVHVYDTMGVNPVPASRVSDDLEGAGTRGPTSGWASLWKSIGSDATGTLTYWTIEAGVPTIASNALTVPPSAALSGGHPDWTDGVATLRFAFSTNSQPSLMVHENGYATNEVRARCDGTSLHLDKHVGGVFTGDVVAPTAAAMTNGVAYWLVVTIVGTTFIAQVFNDNAGAINTASQVGATLSAVITDAGVQSGKMGIFNGGTASFNAGGAFAGVCTMQGRGPIGWTTTIIAGEPAFAWSKVNPHSGTRSLSITSPASGGDGWWVVNDPSTAEQVGTYTISGWIRATGAGTAQLFQGCQTGVGLVVTQDNTWRSATASGVLTAGTCGLAGRMTGAGTAYFDDINFAHANVGSAAHPSWVEVFGPEHNFVGDCVVSNGLLLSYVQAPNSLGRQARWYLWSTALPGGPAWQWFADLDMLDNANNGALNLALKFERIGSEESSVAIGTRHPNSGFVDHLKLRMPRGQYFCRAEFTPLSAFPNTDGCLRLNTNNGPGRPGQLVRYNSIAVADVPQQNLAGGIETDFGYTAAFTPSTGTPYLFGFLLQKKPSAWGIDSTPGVVYLGDNGPAANATSQYGIFAAPFPNIANLAVEAELVGTAGSWVSAIDGTASAGAAEKYPSGAAADSAHLFAAWTPQAGTYMAWARLRVAAIASATNAGQVGVAGGAAYLNLIPNRFTTAHAFYLMTFGGGVQGGGTSIITLNGSQTFQWYVQGLAASPTDIFVDEVVLLPITSSLNNGPQDLWQQFMQDGERLLAPA